MFQELQRRIDNAKELDFGDIFQRSIETFKKVWVQGLLQILITLAISIPFILVIYIPMIVLGVSNPESFETGDFNAIGIGAIIIMAILYIIAIIALATASFALNAAFYRIVKNIDETGETGDANFFMFFKGAYLKKSFLLSLAAVGISLAAYIACVLPIIYVIVPLQFFALFFAFNPNLTVSDIISLSFKLGNKKWLITFGLIIVAGLLAQLIGMILCFIGVFFTASFAYLPAYHIYKSVIGFNSQPDDLLESNSI